LKWTINSRDSVIADVRRSGLRHIEATLIRGNSVNREFTIPTHLRVRSFRCYLFVLSQHPSYRFDAHSFGWRSIVCPRDRHSARPDLGCRSVLPLWVLGGIHWIVLYRRLNWDSRALRFLANLHRRSDRLVPRSNEKSTQESRVQSIIR